MGGKVRKLHPWERRNMRAWMQYADTMTWKRTYERGYREPRFNVPTVVDRYINFDDFETLFEMGWLNAQAAEDGWQLLYPLQEGR